MKAMNATLRRLWRLTRATSIVVGLAVMVGLVAGVASLAVAGPGSGGTTAQAVLKGVENFASTPTTLVNTGPGPENEALRLRSVNSPALRLETKLAGQPALRLHVEPGSPPLAVDPGAGKVDNLVAAKADEATKALKADEATKAANADNADKLDGIDSTQFANSSHTHSGGDITSGTVDADRIEDGSGSGLDADKLDGMDSNQFAAASTGTAFVAQAPRALLWTYTRAPPLMSSPRTSRQATT